MAFKGTHHRGLCLAEWLSFGNKAEGEHSGYSVVKIPVAVADYTAATEMDTLFDLEAGWEILDAWIVVNTTDATETVDVGTDSNQSGTAAGFISAASLATAGFVYPDATVTTGSNETYYASCTRGSLLCNFHAGVDDTNCNQGVYHPKPYKIGTTIDLTYTVTTGTDTAVFDIYLLIYDPTPTATIDTVADNTNIVAA
jgi:hypothetical protein